MRSLAIVCASFAGVQLAAAQAPPIFPPPGATPPPVAVAPAPVTVAAPPTAPQAKIDRAAAEQQCAAHDPDCNWLATLGGLERQSMQRALTARGYQLDPAPWGKVVGHIRVYNEDVFAERGRVLRFFNNFHVTSKEYVVRDEVILRPGEVWDENKIEETARRLRDPIFTSVIAVVPVVSSEPGKVDILVVTRDIWSLRLNTQYTYQSGKLTNLSTSLSENNFLGRRVLLAAAMTMDQGAVAVGPLFLDKNFLGEHLELRVRVNTILSREALFGSTLTIPNMPSGPAPSAWHLDSEGSSSTVALTRTLWNLGAKWGAGVNFTHRFGIDRSFFGTNLRPVWCPPGSPCVKQIDTRNMTPGTFDPRTAPIDEQLPWRYRMKRWGASAYVVRQFGTAYKQQVTLGYGFDSIRPSLLDTFTGSDDQRAAFSAAVLPRSEVTSVPYAGYAMYTPRYKTRRNVQTYDLAEDLRIGPSLDVSVGVGLKLLGSSFDFQRGALSGGWTFPWCRDGSVTTTASISTRHQDGEFIDDTASFNLRVVTPTYRFARIVAESSFGTRWNDTANAFFTIGSDNGLRGFNINQFSGLRLTGTQIEIRSIPKPVWVLRTGAVVFYDVGGAADKLADLRLHHDVGLGLRALVPQTSRELFRFDLAFPLDGSTAGHPRFIAGFQSEF